MVKDVILKFQIDESSFKDGNLLLYNKDQGYFYSITPDMFLHRQEEKIIKLEKNYNEKEKLMKEEVESLRKEIDGLKKEYNNFLTSYKENNEKLLNMVESFITKYGGKD